MVETHGSWKWDPPPPEEVFLISGRGDSIFINPFLLRSELSFDIVAILECTKSTESRMRTLFQIIAPQNQEENPDPHEPKVLLLGTSRKQESSGKSDLRNLSDLEEPPEAPNNQGMLTHIKKLATYVSDLAANFLGFACDAEASVLVLGEDLEIIHIQTEAAHGRLRQDEDMDQEHGKVWGYTRNAVELS